MHALEVDGDLAHVPRRVGERDHERLALAGEPPPPPTGLLLHGAYPNPSSGRTTIAFSLAAPQAVRLAVYDLLGREVAVLAEGYAEAGVHTAPLDARGLAAGTYVYRLTAGGEMQAGRMTLTR